MTGRIILPSAEELVKITRRPTVASLPPSPEYLPPLDGVTQEAIVQKTGQKKLTVPGKAAVKGASSKPVSAAKMPDRKPNSNQSSLGEESFRNDVSSAWLAVLACSILFAFLSVYLIAQNSILSREIYMLKRSKSEPVVTTPVTEVAKLESAE
jgi:hypothetical protein